MAQPDDVEMPEMLVGCEVGHSEAINLITAVVATFGDTPSQFTRAEPSFDKYLLDENVRCNESIPTAPARGGLSLGRRDGAGTWTR